MQYFPDLSVHHTGGAIKAPKGCRPSKLSKGQLLYSRGNTLSGNVMLCANELELRMERQNGEMFQEAEREKTRIEEDKRKEQVSAS